jgi:Uncharacterized conserved protein
MEKNTLKSIKVAFSNIKINTMTTSLVTDPIPLTVNRDGVIRVAGTRVTLDTVVTAFHQGATPEEISLAYPCLNLADIYATISYYLRHQQEVETYLQQRQQEAEEIRRQNEAKFNHNGVRERLMRRQAEKLPGG